MKLVFPTRTPTVSPKISGSYSSPARKYPTSFDRNMPVFDHGEVTLS